MIHKVFLQKNRHQWWLHVAFVLIIAFVVRIPLLNGSFWLDESAQAIESTRPWWQQFQIAGDFQPPLYHLIVHGLQYISHAEWWLRLASLIPALGSILFLMLAVRLWSTQKASVLSGLLLAVSNIHIFFSQELRPYMWAVFWGMISLYSMSLWLQSQVRKEQTRWLGVLVAVNALGALSSYVFIFWWIAQWLTMLILRRRAWLQITASFCVAGLFFMIWWPWFWEQWIVGQTLRAQLPGWEAVVSTPFLKAIPLTLGKFLTGVIELDVNPTFVFTVGGWWAVWGVSLLWAWWKTKTSHHSLHAGLSMVILLFGFSLGIAWIFTLFTPVLAPKRVLYVLPLVLAGIGFIAQYRRMVGFFVATWFIVWQVFAIASYWTKPDLQRENWRALTTEIEHSFSATNTAVVFAFDGPFAPWDWYRQEEWKVFSTGTKPPADYGEVEERLSGIQVYEHVLVFDYLRDLTDPERKIEFVLHEWGYDEIGAITYPGIGPVRMWVRRQLYAQQE